MRMRTPTRKGEAKGRGLAWLALVFLILGGIYLYQRGGGTIVGPGGLISGEEIKGLAAVWDSGTLTHDLNLKNGSRFDLREVNVTITLYREDGEKLTVKQFWAKWPHGEVRKINVPASNYQKVTLIGSAFADSVPYVPPTPPLVGDGKSSINTSWTWDWKRKQ
jgi:hypothetical protein